MAAAADRHHAVLQVPARHLQQAVTNWVMCCLLLADLAGLARDARPFVDLTGAASSKRSKGEGTHPVLLLLLLVHHLGVLLMLLLVLLLLLLFQLDGPAHAPHLHAPAHLHHAVAHPLLAHHALRPGARASRQL